MVTSCASQDCTACIVFWLSFCRRHICDVCNMKCKQNFELYTLFYHWETEHDGCLQFFRADDVRIVWLLSAHNALLIKETDDWLSGISAFRRHLVIRHRNFNKSIFHFDSKFDTIYEFTEFTIATSKAWVHKEKCHFLLLNPILYFCVFQSETSTPSIPEL